MSPTVRIKLGTESTDAAFDTCHRYHKITCINYTYRLIYNGLIIQSSVIITLPNKTKMATEFGEKKFSKKWAYSRKN